MTILLDADSPRGVQLFCKLYCGSAVQLMIFPKQKKWRKRILIQTKQTLDETRKYKVTKFWLIVRQDWNIMFTLRIIAYKSWIKCLRSYDKVGRCNFVMLKINSNHAMLLAYNKGLLIFVMFENFATLNPPRRLVLSWQISKHYSYY